MSHHVRTKLDELKRQEVSRLRTLIKAKQDIEGGNGTQTDTIRTQYMLHVVFWGSFSLSKVLTGGGRRVFIAWIKIKYCVF